MDIPKTEAMLAQWMKDNCHNFLHYAINGNLIDEGFGIEREGNFIWYYTERGVKTVVKQFLTEEEIIAHAFHQIKNDKWSQTHCIGFTTDPHKHRKLAETLLERGITFFESNIPNFHAGQTAFRTFVLGCDKQLTAGLKAQFYDPTLKKPGE